MVWISRFKAGARRTFSCSRRRSSPASTSSGRPTGIWCICITRSNAAPSLQFSMCMGSKADTYAGVKTLANMIYSHPDILRFAKERRQKRANPAG
ncbi:hypothetical protein HN011_004754 [Eciton burchellii]|nr:hypothetical protein HN011_004754 [Eciton burchellii]